jgi:hypothetical protein
MAIPDPLPEESMSNRLSPASAYGETLALSVGGAKIIDL